ncbi:HipA N-terminal domain-containing protein [Aequorivita todarodis]|uniref:HipA N-terminal domain-containing protein n=1 Tax=Aequorivita todarodis TaxID=2036821 RepID=UPI0023503C20|nr:HipA N-terminal domain-containing protein [Aequorivita todarodis]MDC8001187.1 HipA N-terminal domain-containing protein [Aequorivita todarodis]
MRQGEIWVHDRKAGMLTENEEGYQFQYDTKYLSLQDATPVSLTLPLQEMAFRSEHLFPFFDGLIPEGWLLDIAQKNWKLNPRDRMELLLATCRDCIGNVSVIANE